MATLNKIISSIIILLLCLIPIFSSEPDLSFANKEIIENEDLCLRRPYHKQAEPFYFVPALRAKLLQVGDKFSFPSRCYKKNIVSFKEISKDKITLSLQNIEKLDTFCSELFIFHTSNHNFLQFILFEGEHTIVLKYITQNDKDEIKLNGIKLYSFCAGLGTTIQSIFKTFKAYYGGIGYDPKAKNPRFRPSISRDQEKANLRIMELYNHYTPERRKNNTIVNFDKNIVKTGDVMVISRMDGIDQLIMIGAGGHVGHCVVCAWRDNELYVVEAQAAWYWPRKGIQKNKWEDWVKWANIAEFNVVLLPLRDEYRNKLDPVKAWSWYDNEVEGLPYGFHNFIFSWIDTTNSSFPFITTNDFAELFFSLLEKFSPSTAYSFGVEALNIRLKTTNLTFPEVIAEAARRGMTIEELMAIPEEEFVYHDGFSYTCSCFVIAFWKHGGLFGDMEILPNEFSPRDLYTLDVFDKNFQRPQECIDDNPDLPYCQVTGKFIVDLDNYSTVKPYSHMNERCPSIGPDFIREDGC